MNKYFITSGSGTSSYKLVAFDNALLSAGISNYNLVRVSSILPARCERQQDVNLEKASPLHTAYAVVSSNIPGERIATAIAVGIPKNSDDMGHWCRGRLQEYYELINLKMQKNRRIQIIFSKRNGIT